MQFGLRKKSFKTHLSSNMEVRSPKYDHVISDSAELSPSINNVPNSQTIHSGHLEGMLRGSKQLTQRRIPAKGNFFNSTVKVMMRRSKDIASEARMNFKVEPQKVPE